jgi:hypothetical protein
MMMYFLNDDDNMSLGFDWWMCEMGAEKKRVLLIK